MISPGPREPAREALARAIFEAHARTYNWPEYDKRWPNLTEVLKGGWLAAADAAMNWYGLPGVWLVMREGSPIEVGVYAAHATEATAIEDAQRRGGRAQGYYVEQWSVETP